MSELNNTLHNINIKRDEEFIDKKLIKENLNIVYQALCEKGYNPVAQITGYILSEDPTYITSYNGARNIMKKLDRYDILEVLLEDYVQNNYL